jgi:hypothetical protein
MGAKHSAEIQSEGQPDEKGFIDELKKKGVEKVDKFRDKLLTVLHERHNKAISVNELFPEFKTKSDEHDFLKSMANEELVLPVGRGGWTANSLIILTKEGRDLARNHNLPVMPFIFVSYSHEDEKYRRLLVKHLKVPELYTHLKIWDDTQISAGVEWKPEIKMALNRADASVLLISADFLSSDFIKDEEIPDIFAPKGRVIFPILVRPCAWEQVKWLSEIQVRSIGGKSLSECDEPKIEKFLAKITVEIMGCFNTAYNECF